MELRAIEIRRANEQRGRCIYCYNPTWARPFEPQGVAMLRMRYLRCERQADYWSTLGSFLASIEHLTQRASGGNDDAGNIASSCKFCNGDRGDHTVRDWQAIVARRQWVEKVAGTQVIRLEKHLCVEAPLQEVRELCQRVSAVNAASYDLRNSIAVIYPAYDGDPSASAREHVYKNRQTLFGTRALFETDEQRQAVARHFGNRVYRWRQADQQQRLRS